MKIKLSGGLLLWSAALFLATAQSGWAGACLASRFHDNKDLGCHKSPGSANGGGNQSSCPDCEKGKNAHGMPRWGVSEPYINLWLTDEPLSYQTSSGQEMTFRFMYRQRYMLPQLDEVPNIAGRFGDVYSRSIHNYGMASASWGNNWLMDIGYWDTYWDSQNYNIYDPNGTAVHHTANFTKFSQGYEALAFGAEGGVQYFVNNSGGHITNQTTRLTDPLSQVTLQPQSSYPAVHNPTADANGIYWGNTTDGFKLTYPDGSQDIFGITDNGSQRARLTQKIDPQGRATLLGYENVAHTNFLRYPLLPDYYGLRVRYVVDPDGKTNTFRYTLPQPEHLWELTEIDDPYGRSTLLSYQSGLLSSITDSAGLTSSFQYQAPGPPPVPIWCLDTSNGSNAVYYICGYSNGPSMSSGWMTTLTTPYGSTSFKYFENRDSDLAAVNSFQQRALYVSEPTGANQLFYFVHHPASGLATTATAPTVPGHAFDDGTAGANHSTLDYRNTLHWDRRQTAALSAGVLSYLNANNLTNAVNALTAADFKKGRLKHWLWQADNLSIAESLSSERDPSPDAAGQTEGLRTWYDYPGKSTPEMEGSSVQVSCIARLLPDSTSQYASYTYGYPWQVLCSQTSYSKPDGSMGEVTNWFQYAANNIDVLSVSNSAGQFERYGYNSLHQIVFATNALNYVTALGWDASTHNLTNVALPTGQTIGLTYGSQSLVSQISVAPNGLTIAIPNYTNSVPQVVHTSGTGFPDLWVSNTWDGLNRPTSTAYQDGSYTSNRFDKLDLSASRDRTGNWTYFGHDGLQHLTATTNANNAVTSYSWCGCGALTSITDALTNITTLYYNNQGLLTNVIFPDTSSLTYAFDLAGRNMSVKDGLNRGLNYGYNNQDLTTTVSNAYGLVSQTVYDLVNRPISRTDANAVTVTHQFDLLNHLTARTWPDNFGEGYGYSTNGLIAYTNRNQQVTRYLRDGAGRLTAETNANLEVTQFGYDAASHLISLLDGLNHSTTWHYNQYGWQTNKLDALSREVLRYAYNSNGQLTNRWMLGSGNTAYSFDAVGNLKSIVYPGLTISYAYDALNRLTNMVDAVGTTVFSYTQASQLQGEDGPWTSDAVTYGYTQQLRTALTLTQSGTNWPQTYGYDSALRLTSLSSPAGGFLYGYSAQASTLISQLNLPNGAYITNHYDSLERLDYTALMNHWGHALDGYSYQMDLLGLRTNVTRDFGLTKSVASAGYDNIGQLTGWNATETNGVPRLNEQLAWVYDKAHNLRYRTNNLLVQTFTNDPVNQLTNITRTGTLTLSGATPAAMTSVTVNGQSAQTYGDFSFVRTNLTLANGQNSFTNVAGNQYGSWNTNTFTANLPGTNTLQFDLNGNLTNDGTKAFFYDAENQLTNVVVAGSWKSEFVYDGLNRRRIARDYTWTAGAWSKTNEVRFVYDRMLSVQERDASGNVLVTYTRGLDLSGTRQGAGGIGGLLARTDTNGSTFYHTDGAGNITALMDGNENMVARYLYNPFGKLAGQWGALADANVMRFSSMPVHRLSGIPHFSYRDLGDGRFLQRDPIGERGGINLYGFVGNNPVNNNDPLGLWWWDRDLIQVGGPQLLHDLFIGDNNGPAPDPNSQGALSENAGYGFHPLTDADGNQLGNPASAIGGAVVGGLVDAASLLAGGGEAKAAVKCEKAAAKDLTSLYQKVGAKGEHLKFGITKNPATRYTKEELAGGRLKILGQGSRQDMLQLERNLHETLPIGPEEGQNIYNQIQAGKGLKPPPY